MGSLGVQVFVHSFFHPFVCVLTPAVAATLASTPDEVYKLENFTVNFTSLFYLTELNKDDNPSGAWFHSLVCRCDINFNEVLYNC